MAAAVYGDAVILTITKRQAEQIQALVGHTAAGSLSSVFTDLHGAGIKHDAYRVVQADAFAAVPTLDVVRK